MIKDIIYDIYTGKEYQVSTAFIYDCYFETMIFPIEDGVVSGREVYKWESYNLEEAVDKHRDIKNRPQAYISKESIAEYIRLKEADFETEETIPFPFQFVNKYFLGEMTMDDAVSKTVDEVERLIREYVEKHNLKLNFNR